MKKSITISIPEPCHENWQIMTPTEKGKFCQVCTKEVIDFTEKADEDLVKILSKGKSTCGRFKKSQLNREVKLERKSGMNLAPYAASLLLPLSLLSTQGVNSRTETPEKPYSSLGIGKYSNPDRALIKTSGIVRDENGHPIAKIQITSNELQKTAVSDSEGNYTITTMDHEVLTFHKEGFQTHEIKINGTSEVRDITMFSIIPNHMIVGKMVQEPIIIGDVINITTVETTIEEVEESSTIEINGTVKDETGLALPGVNIVVKGTSSGTQTDLDGNYKIEVEANQVLTFSYVGFVTEEITLSNISNTIDIQFLEQNMILGGAVALVCYATDKYGDPILPVDNTLLDEKKRKVWRDDIKSAYQNEIEYSKIKKAKKKAARKLKKKIKLGVTRNLTGQGYIE